MGIRVLAIGTDKRRCNNKEHSNNGIQDTGEEKKNLSLSLGAEKWIDFQEAGDNLIQQVVAATNGGPHCRDCNGRQRKSNNHSGLVIFILTVPSHR